MKIAILILSIIGALVSAKYDSSACEVVYDSDKKFASVCNHYIKVNDKKYTIIDNGCHETKTLIIDKLKKNGCDMALTFDSYREDWASK